MKYNVVLLKNGEKIDTDFGLTAKSHKGAIDHNEMRPQRGYVVFGARTAKLFDSNFVEAKGEVRLYKYGKQGYEYLMVMVGNVPMCTKFTSGYKRDEAFEKCTELISASTVKNEKLLTTIIACLDAVKDTPSLLTGKKTTKDFAGSAILTGKSTLSKTAETSGKSKSRDTASDTWSSGFQSLPSKPDQTSYKAVVNKKCTGLSIPSDMVGELVTVTKVDDDQYHDGKWYYSRESLDFVKMTFAKVLPSAKEINIPDSLIGKTIEVYESKVNGMFVYGNKLFTKATLDFENVTLKVKNVKVDTWGSWGGSFVPSMEKFIGRTLDFKLTKDVEFKWYEAHGWYFDKSWLEVSDEVPAKKADYKIVTCKDVRGWTKADSGGKRDCFIPSMQFCGNRKAVPLKYRGWYSIDGYSYHESWLNFKLEEKYVNLEGC